MNSFFTNLIRKVMSFHWRARLLFYVRVEGGRKLTSKFVHRPQDSLLLHIGCVSIRHTYNEYVIEGVPVWVVDVQPEATKKLYIYIVFWSRPEHYLCTLSAELYVYSSSNHTTDNQLALNVVLWLFTAIIRHTSSCWFGSTHATVKRMR